MNNPSALSHVRNTLLVCVLALPGIQRGEAAPTTCDCTKIVGSCTASYLLYDIRNDPTRINSRAELKINSSSACSRVDYYVDGTPYQSVILGNRVAYESIFGTSTINDSSISIKSCMTCATTEATSARHEEEADPAMDRYLSTTPGEESEEQEVPAPSYAGSHEEEEDSSAETADSEPSGTSVLGAIIGAGISIYTQKKLSEASIPSGGTSSTRQTYDNPYHTGGGLVDQTAPRQAPPPTTGICSGAKCGVR